MNAPLRSLALVLLIVPLSGRAQISPPSAPASAPVANLETDIPPPLTIYRVGGDVRPPRMVNKVNVPFIEDAHNQKIPGDVVISFYVDLQGMPQDIRLLRGAGHGIDEQAVAAVQQYRFKPGTKNGVPVAVRILSKFNWN